MLNYDEQYAIQQVCENGHQITGCYKVDMLTSMLNTKKEPKEFCESCGAATLIACPSCDTKIQGDKLKDNYGKRDTLKHSVVPSYCLNCGKPYPWTENKIVTAIQMFAEFGDLNDEEKKTIKEDINNIAKDIPQARLSAMRLKPICQRYGKVAYDVLMEFASKTTAEILKN
jgi:hypothetical protein